MELFTQLWDKVKSRKLVVVAFLILKTFPALEAPWLAYAIVGGVYVLAEAIQEGIKALKAAEPHAETK